MDSIDKWTENDKNRYLLTLSLHDTSWELRHSSPGMIHSADNLTELLYSIEKAFKHLVLNNDAWWQKNEPRLRNTDDLVIRYFVIQAYKENIEANIPGIEFQLLDEELLNKSDLIDEIGELMQIACPLISPEVRIKNQEIILSWIPIDDNNEKLYVIKVCYDYLIWIPNIFRTAETQYLIERWQDYFGYAQPFFRERSRGGDVSPPISPEELVQLSDAAILRLLNYYQQNPRVNTFDEMTIGGLDFVLRVLAQASSLHPQKFLDLFSLFIKENLHQDFLISIIEGVSRHLIYRFGNSRSMTEWKPIEPLPEGKTIAAQLLNLLERYNIIWSNRDAVAEALQACSHVIENLESAERITLLLFWLKARDITLGTMPVVNSKDNLYGKAINSPRGKAAEASMILCNRLLEQGKALPVMLPYLLRHFARDSVTFVRTAILNRLSFLMYKSPQLGWQLLADCLKEPEPRLWTYVERSLYYQYQNNFNLVQPYLNRLFDFKEAMDEAGETWGRISTLASLTGHITQQELFQNLEQANIKAWKGAAQVFVANYQQHHTVCHRGILNILSRDNLTDDILLEIEKCFNREKNKGAIKQDLATAFLKALPSVSNGNHLDYFLEWLSLEAHRSPLSVFDLVETLAKKIESEHQPWFGGSKPLITVLNAILREADELDDPQLIQRAIALQDSFFKLDFQGINEMLDKAQF